ncbi:MAG: tetratricopeptide repeat protein [Chloroflexi bacterium]|nr:tetratricopeptide repeat protein [Chloroflexota bacterium]
MLALVLLALVVVAFAATRMTMLEWPVDPPDAVDFGLPGQSRLFQTLFTLEQEAADAGWLPDRAELAGRVWWELGNPREAVSYWQMAGSSTSVRRRLAEAYLELGEWGFASDTLKLLDVDMVDASLRAWSVMQLGLIHAAADPQAARAWLERAAAAETGYSDSLDALIDTLSVSSNPVRIGMALAHMGLWSFAEHAFADAPFDPVALAFTALSREMQGKDGTSHLRSALELGAGDSQVHYIEGLVYRQRLEYEDSLSAFIQAVALHPDDPALYAELGTAYQLTGDLVSAEHWLQMAADLSGDGSRYADRLEELRTEEAMLREVIGLMIDDEQASESEDVP